MHVWPEHESLSVPWDAPRVVSSVAAAKRARMAVFSGHDTVIAPVLAGLGVYNDQALGLCSWPRYASHINFERWAHSDSLSPSGLKYGIKVHYNGLDITSHIPACREANVGVEPCPLHAMETQLKSLLVSFPESFVEACAE